MIEVWPSLKEAGKAEVEANVRLVAKSGGLLPPVEPELLEIETVVSSHTTSVVRIAYYATTHKIRVIEDKDMEKLSENGFFP